MTMNPIRRSIPIKGMNTVTPPRTMGEEYAPVLENTWYDDGITLRRRLCHSVANTTAAPNGGIKETFEYSYGTTTNKFIQDLTGLISLEDDTANTYTTQAITYTGEIGVAQLKDLSIIGDGVANAQKFNGTAWSAITTTPTPVGDATIGSVFLTYKGRVYAAGNTALPLTVFISDTITNAGIDYWGQTTGAANELGYLLDVSGDITQGDEIVGLASHRGFLVVLCKNHILFYTVVESPTSGLQTALYKAVEGEGCISHKSIRAVGEETIFLSPNGFKNLSVSLIQGDSQVNDISQPINNDVKALLNGGTVVTADIRSTYNPRYGLYICNMGNTTWAHQTQIEGWFKWIGLNNSLYTDTALKTYASGAYACTLDNTVFVDEITPSVFTQIQYRWVTPPFRSPNVDHNPRWRKLELIYETNSILDNITIDYYINLDVTLPFSGTYTLSPNATLENGLKTGRFELPIVGRGELISFDIKNNSNSDFRMKIVEVYMNDGGIR